MSNRLRGRDLWEPLGLEKPCHRADCWRHRRADDGGFTLVELLIVLVVLPIIVGALSLGILSVLSLQSSVANRLSDTEDAQVVASDYANDIQGAYNITTDSSGTLSPTCSNGTGTLVLGLENDLNYTTGEPQSIVSYISVPGTGSTTTLERLSCAFDAVTGTWDVANQVTLAYDVSGTSPVPGISYVGSCTGACIGSASAGWTAAYEIYQVLLPVNEATHAKTTPYSYTLVAAPEASTAETNEGSPVSTSSTTTCSTASPGTGPYAPNLCFIDFSSLTGGALTAATDGGCLEMSVNVGGGDTMYFCLSISGEAVAPYALPTYPEAFLGNSNAQTTITALKNVPFYTNVPGEPALYQTNNAGGTTTVTFSKISVVTSSGQLATGWQLFGADAETTDNGEYINWTTSPSTSPLSILPDGIAAVDTTNDPVGNACGAGQGLYYINTGSGIDYSAAPSNAGLYTEVECQGSGTILGNTFTTTSGWKDGATFVIAPQPTQLTVNMHGTGLEGLAVGLYDS